MRVLAPPKDFNEWRTQARMLLAENVAPGEAVWEENGQCCLFSGNAAGCGQTPAAAVVPKLFLTQGRLAALNRAPDKWSLLYRLLWRICAGEKQVLRDVAEPDVRRLFCLAREVSSDIHRMRGFVRFERMQIEGRESLVAFYRPMHRIVSECAAYFLERQRNVEWAILTPAGSAYWDKRQLRFGPTVHVLPGRSADAARKMWQAYYAAAFQPERLNVRQFNAHIPRQFRQALPELETRLLHKGRE